MQKYKQLLIDILVILIVPIGVVVISRGMVSGAVTELGSPDALLSVESPLSGVATPGESGGLGAKSKEILNQLNSIKFDVAFLSDPAFLSLQDFTPPYATSTKGRAYPFSLPDDVRVMKVQSSGAPVPTTVQKPSSVVQKTTSPTKVPVPPVR